VLKERLLQRDDEFASLRQTQESTTAALTDAVVRRSRIEAPFAHTQSVSPPKAVTTPRIPEPVPTTPLSAKATGPALGSTIISGFADVFAGFRGKVFALLWRGGRDDFRGCSFHSRCGVHANIFGGFTPLEWESRDWNWNNKKEDNRYKADANLKSFLCDPKCGPYFRDIFVSDNPNANTNSHTFLGDSSTKDLHI
jgi:hypothetical protein